MVEHMAEASSPPAPFTACTARNALTAACKAAGLDDSGARLLRFGENALFHLPGPGVVVRIARGLRYWKDAATEVGVARWLARQGFPAARLHDTPQPVEAGGRPVTFWRYIDGRNGGRGDIADLARMLRRLHQLPAPDFALPAENILGRVRGRLETAAVSAPDRDFLFGRLAEAEEELPRLRFPLAAAATHGDAHVQNLMVTADGPVLIDFERFAWGQPEWDLSMTATEWLTAGWWSRSEYERFAGAYEFDVTSWPGFPVLRRVHELKMVSWLSQNVGESPDNAREFQVRMRSLRGLEAGPWRPF